jgi:hypothetical protein
MQISISSGAIHSAIPAGILARVKMPLKTIVQAELVIYSSSWGEKKSNMFKRTRACIHVEVATIPGIIIRISTIS